jgi:hypothetical protein
VARFTKWAGQAVRQKGWNLNPRAALSGMALVGGLSLLAAFYLALSSQTAVLGRRLQDMELERTNILRENAYLRDQIARTVSVENMRQRAFAANFVTSGTVVFVPIPLPEDMYDESVQTAP